MGYDFTGIATRYGIKCSDGRTILHGAFKENDKQTVPLVWQHFHDTPSNILGKAYLEHTEDGVKISGIFHGKTEESRTAKALVEDGTITALSIWANKLVEQGKRVIHGAIREVSLVISGANPEAKIESVVLSHSDDIDDEGLAEALIFSDRPIEIFHAATPVIEEVKEIPKTPMDVVSKIEETIEEEVEDDLKHAEGDKTVQDVFDSLTEEQKNVVYAMLAAALEDEGIKQSEGGEGMKRNIFDKDSGKETGVLTHTEGQELFASMMNDIQSKKFLSLKDAFIAHAGDYGIDNIDILFPDARSITTTPDFVKRDDAWVERVLRSTRHTPFSRIKSITADITGDEARAKGYIKGNKKTEEVFNLLKRVTLPTTIYKKQKLDRDDVIDITEFDSVAWLRAEMRMMLDEEIARAILVGDGREPTDPDKINEENIRPIYKDADLYSVKIKIPANATPAQKIEAINRSRVQYKGSGNPVYFTTETGLIDMLLLTDTIGRRLYNNEADLAAAMRVSAIIPVEVMEGYNRMDTDGTTQLDLEGIIVNLRDYTIGADRGGQVAMFDDFDIDYNQMKYLIETRISGCLIRPYSAIVLEQVHDDAAG